MSNVVLNELELAHCDFEMGLRQGRTVDTGRIHKYGLVGVHLDIEMESICAEFAVAKYLNQYPTAICGVGSSDVGENIEVRWTQNKCLLVHKPEEGDNPDDIFVMVTGSDGGYEIKGWLQGYACQQERYWRTDIRKPAYLVPVPDLNAPFLLVRP